MSERVFIIINEWTDEDQDFEVIYGDRFWASEAGALVALQEYADRVHVEIPKGETSFDVPDQYLLGLERDEYYIRELTRG